MAIKEFLQDCKNNILKLPIGDNTTFHSDGEAIYKSKTVKEVLDTHNIYQNYSQNYHPQQNGMAERTYRTIFADARAMLNTSPLSNDYYPLAITHAVMLRNLIQKGNRKMSAYELLTGNNPKEILSKLHIFGAKVYLHKSGNEVTKMEENSSIGIYIGYDIKSKSHKIFNPITKKITTSINIRVDDRVNSNKIKIKKQSDSTERKMEKEPFIVPEDETATEIYEEAVIIPVKEHVSKDPLLEDFDEDIINNIATTKEINTSIPKNITQAFKSDESDQWIKSTIREVEAMITNQVWTIPTNIPENAKIINSILVYRKKEDIDIEDKDLLYKSRLVILGNLQNESQFDPNKISSPVMNSTTCRALFAKSAIEKWSIHHLDVVTALSQLSSPRVRYYFYGTPKRTRSTRVL